MELIVAPHPDDAIIGCYKVLKRNKFLPTTTIVAIVSDVNEENEGEVKKLEEYVSGCGKVVLCNGVLSALGEYLKKVEVVYVPSLKDYHPLHQRVTKFIQAMEPEVSFEIVYYSTNMNIDFLQELSPAERDEKLKLLNEIFPSQKSLWEYDWKYFLFEGYHKQVKV